MRNYVLKGVSTELCGMECIDLIKNLAKTLRIHFSYNKKIEIEKNFIKLIRIENVLKIWRTRNLTIQGKITVFNNVPHVLIDQLN